MGHAALSRRASRQRRQYSLLPIDQTSPICSVHGETLHNPFYLNTLVQVLLWSPVLLMPRRFISQADPDVGPWARWARLVTHHAGVMAALGIAIVVVVMIPAISLNPGDALAKNMPGSGPAITGRDQLAAAGISAGAISPIAITVQGATPSQIPTIVAGVGKSEGIAGASAPRGWSRDGLTVIEAVPVPADDGHRLATRARLLPDHRVAVEGDRLLENEERDVVMRVVAGVEKGLRDLLAPDKVNLASLGNLVPHLHWHVIPRYRDDSHFPEPIWAAPQRVGVARSLPHDFAARMKRALDRALA